MEDNETLKRDMAKITTENEILRATSHSNNSNNQQRNQNQQPSDPEPTTTGPMNYKPAGYALDGGNKPAIVHRSTVDETSGDKLLDPGAAWDLITSHIEKSGATADVQDIYNRLEGHTRCDGTGPVFGEARIKKAIEESIAAGNDELI